VLRCDDPVLAMSFEQPAAWGPMTASLRNSIAGTGLAYDYLYEDLPGVILAGGRSADFTEGRGGMLTDFAGSGPLGLGGLSPEAWCDRLTAAICTVVQSNVVLAFRFVAAEPLCNLPDPSPFEHPLAFVWVLLPDNPQINGFVFAAPFLSDEAAEHVLELRREILGWSPETYHTRCAPDQQAAFDEALGLYLADLDAGQVDAETLENVAALRHLAESVVVSP
jgi:hypothetical protein